MFNSVASEKRPGMLKGPLISVLIKLSFSCDSNLCWLQRESEVGSVCTQPVRADGSCPLEVSWRFVIVFIGLRSELPKERTWAPPSMGLGKEKKPTDLGHLMFMQSFCIPCFLGGGGGKRKRNILSSPTHSFLFWRWTETKACTGKTKVVLGQKAVNYMILCRESSMHVWPFLSSWLSTITQNLMRF